MQRQRADVFDLYLVAPAVTRGESTLTFSPTLSHFLIGFVPVVNAASLVLIRKPHSPFPILPYLSSRPAGTAVLPNKTSLLHQEGPHRVHTLLHVVPASDRMLKPILACVHLYRLWRPSPQIAFQDVVWLRRIRWGRGPILYSERQ